MDQAVKCIEDMQDDFDFCYKTLQSRGAFPFICDLLKLLWINSFSNFLKIRQTLLHQRSCRKRYKIYVKCTFVTLSAYFCSESSDRNSDMMKMEVTRLQDMLNRLDFKRKVGIFRAVM